MKNFLLITLLINLFLYSCKNCDDHTNADCDNYIECVNGEQAIISSFGIGGKLVLPSNQFHDKIERYIELDTVSTGTVRLWSKMDYGVTRWSIEDDFEIYKDDEILLEFGDSYHGSQLNAELEAYTFFACLSDEERRDVSIQNIVFRNYQGTPERGLPIYGQYEGAFDGGSDNFTITINEQTLEGLPSACNSAERYIKYYDRFFLEADDGNSCNDFYAEGLLSNNQQKITITIKIEDDSEILEKVFVGNRI